MMDTVIHTAAAAAFFCWLGFLIWYSIRAKWWRVPEGRNVWGVALALTAALGMVNASYIWPDYSLRPIVVLTVYVSLALLGIQRTVQMERNQRKD